MLRSARLCTIALCAAGLLVAGCATPVPPRSGAADPLSPTEQVARLRLPFDAYDFSVAELYTISNAEDMLIDECMEKKRYKWDIVERPTDLKDLRNRRRYGVIEIGIAQFGYHVPAGLLTPLDVEKQYGKRERALGDREKEAAYGPHGCGRAAAGRLRSDDPPDPARLMYLGRLSLDDSQDDPHVAKAMDSWRGCMRHAGFDYEDPFAAMSDPRWWAQDSSRPSGKEITVAVADVHCKDQVDLVDAWYAAEERIQREMIGRYPNYFRQLRIAMEKELDAANAVLAQP